MGQAQVPAVGGDPGQFGQARSDVGPVADETGGEDNRCRCGIEWARHYAEAR
jgi:hypothetical protein